MSKKTTIRIAIKVFCGFIVLFHLLWGMFHDESSEPAPIKFEMALLMIVVAVLSNLGFFLSSGEFGVRFKKTTVISLFLAAFLNFNMFASFYSNPFLLLDLAQWYHLRRVLVWSAPLCSLAVAVFVLRDQSDG
jgi:hypothetical protein